MNQIPNIIGVDSAMSQKMIDTGVNGDHGVEDAGLGVGIELQQDGRLHRIKPALSERVGGSRKGSPLGRDDPLSWSSSFRSKSLPQSAKGCFAVSLLARTSLGVGLPAMAF